MYILTMTINYYYYYMDRNTGQRPPHQNDGTMGYDNTDSNLCMEACIEEKYASVSPNVFGESVEETPIPIVEFQSPTLMQG